MIILSMSSVKQASISQTPLTTHTVMLESADPVAILSSLRLAWRPHTLSWCASSVFTHSLVLMVHSFTKPSEPLRRGSDREHRIISVCHYHKDRSRYIHSDADKFEAGLECLVLHIFNQTNMENVLRSVPLKCEDLISWAFHH